VAAKARTSRAGSGQARQTRPPEQGRPAALNSRRHLGSYTSDKPDGYEERPNPLEGIGFTLDGEEFRCEGKLDLLDTSELTILSMSSMDTRSPQGMAMIAQFLQLAFGPMEYMRFKAHLRMHETPDDVTLNILADISDTVGATTERLTGRPTRRRSSSSPGPEDGDGRVSRIISLGREQGDVTVIDQEAMGDQTR
jgi:hypothetical protein